MLLDRIDIDNHGPLEHVEIGPLTERLNVILTPEGAGKTALVRFVRDSLVSREYPLGMMNSSTGRVVWADRHGLLHCRREQDGSAAGRRTIEFESRGEYQLRFDSLDQSWIRGAGDTTDASLALQSIQLPEAIVDGVITDTSVTNVTRVVAACIASCVEVAGSTSATRTHDGRPLPASAAPGRFDLELDRKLRAQAADLEAELAGIPVGDEEASLMNRRSQLVERLAMFDHAELEWIDREAIAQELARLDERLAAGSRVRVLRRQLVDLYRQLDGLHRGSSPETSLSRTASRWLVRLSAGRLRQVSWNSTAPESLPVGSWASARNSAQPGHLQSLLAVKVNGWDESACSAADRALAVLAVRLAAGEALAQSGRPVPVVIEMHRELLESVPEQSIAADPYAAPEHNAETELQRAAQLYPIASTLIDYAHAGHQVVVLTSRLGLTEQLAQHGGRVFRLFDRPVVHPHRPLWKPQYSAERYVGPHPHSAAQTPIDSSYHWAERQRVDEFGSVWRDAYGVDQPAGAMPTQPVATDLPTAAELHRDGYYYLHRYSTAEDTRPTSVLATPAVTPEAEPTAAPSSPFFLSVDSPIDQAASVDAVAAARLRRLGITHINHLMQQDSNRLADTLGLSNVNAATIRRWQHECRLMCRVPNLRGFDARLLVGAGINDPDQLAAMSPAHLLDRIEAFLATERGQRILLSGTSYELSRLASWIASANRGVERRTVDTVGHRQTATDTSRRGEPSSFAFGRERTASNDGAPREGSDSNRRANRGSTRRTGRSVQTNGHAASRSAASERKSVVRIDRDAERNGSGGREDSQSANRSHHVSDLSSQSDDVGELRFYLHRDSPVEAAPTIGPRMAERLTNIGIETVDDLLQADPETIAADLDHRRVDGETVRQWQQQSTLVCRVPMLRGHDAQLLVAADVTTAEQLAQCDPAILFNEIDPIARSPLGKRILRGGDLPDLDEVSDWILYACHQRPLMAA